MKTITYGPETIWKFRLKLDEHQELNLPMGARILDIQKQGEHYALWAVVDPGVKTVEKHDVYVVGTGMPMPTPLYPKFYRCTQDGPMVWHWFVQVPAFSQ